MTAIRAAVSLYSLQDCCARGRLDLPGCLAFIAGLGAEGVELISDQIIPGTPRPSEDTVRIWRTALDETGLVPVCANPTGTPTPAAPVPGDAALCASRAEFSEYSHRDERTVPVAQ